MWACCAASKFSYNLVESPTRPPLMTNESIEVADVRYTVPTTADMAVCFVIFNPSKSKRMIMNYLYMLEKLKLAKIPTFTLELTFDDALPEIVDAVHVRASSHLFHKERLCRLLEPKIPKKYTKLCFMDADVVFDNPNWYAHTSSLLNNHDVVQPFTNALWLDLTYKQVVQERLSVIFMDKTKTFNSNYHPGFVWAFSRKWYNRVGYYDYGISGSGDTMSAAAWLGVDFPPNYLKPAYAASFKQYKETCKLLPRMACTPGKLYHLWHGNRTNRKYVARHECMNDIEDVRKILAVNEDGVFELLDRQVHVKLKQYFDEREDDGLS